MEKLLIPFGLVLTALFAIGIVFLGGGPAFLHRPVAVTDLILWVAWWVVIILLRPQGVASEHEQKQRGLMAATGVVMVLLILVPPYEYAHCNGPIPRDTALAWAGLALFAAGVYLQAASMRALQGLYTKRLGIQPGHRLITSGPYRFFRHPGYSSHLLCMLGIGLALSSLAALALTLAMIPLLILRIRGEEAMLLDAFGEEYRRYLEKTKRLLPIIY